MHPQISRALEQFGQHAGLADCGRSPNLALRLAEGRHLLFAADATSLRITLAATARGDSLELATRALQQCHQRHGWPLPLAAGLDAQARLQLITRLPAAACQLHTLEQAADFLLRRLTQLEG